MMWEKVGRDIYSHKNILPSAYWNPLQDEFDPTNNNWIFDKNEVHYDSEVKTHCRGFIKKYFAEEVLVRGVGSQGIGDNLLFIKIGEYLKTSAKKVIRKPIKLIRINTNIQFLGQESNFHVDGPPDKETWTLVVFANKDWNVEWGGAFVRYDDKNNKYDHVAAIPNTAALFEATSDHKGMAPTIHAIYPRMTIAFTYDVI